MWPKDKRPEGLKSSADIRKFTTGELKDYFEMQKIKEKVEKNANYETLTKDSKIPKKKFKSGIDDCAKNLHPARWLRYPVVHPKKFLKKMPVARTPAYRNMELEFFGFNGRVADRTIVSLHDRAVPLQIKHFLSENCSVTSKPRKEIKRLEEEGLSSTIDFSWENPNNLTQIQEGFNNYKFLLYLIWPADPTGMIMHNVLSTYKWAAGAGDQRTRQSIVTSYFNTALRDNASRATNKQLVMSVKEHERIFKDCMIKMNVRPEIPLMSQQYNQQAFQQGNQSNTNKPFSSNPQTGNKQGGQNIKKRASSNGVPCCFTYNSMESGRSCRNKLTATGCRDQQGRSFAHACNVWMEAKKGHCLGRHKRRDHR